MKRKPDTELIHIKPKKKKLLEKENLKEEIKDVYNLHTFDPVESFEDIRNLYTIIEAYEKTETGKSVGFKNKTFLSLFDDLIMELKKTWVEQRNISEKESELWETHPVRSIGDIHAAIALVYIHRHMYNAKTGEYQFEFLEFANLRELTKHKVIEILKTWGVENTECLFKHVSSIPGIIEIIHHNADFMYYLGIENISLNINVARLARESERARV